MNRSKLNRVTPSRVVFLAFAVAGLVEWLFHPCNPMGFAAMTVLAPLLTFQEKRRKTQ